MSTPAAVVETTLSPLQQLVKDYPPELVQKVKDIVDQEKEKEIVALGEVIRQENKKTIDGAIEEMRAKMKPPSPEDLQKLLEQELLTFTIKIPPRRSSKAEEREFKICELPQAVEKKILRVMKDRLVPVATEISSLTLTLLEGDAAKKIIDLMNTFEPALEVLTDICVIVLNPYDEMDDIDSEWVQNHLTTQKILAVVMAQFEANRMRDFFLQLSQGMSSLSR